MKSAAHWATPAPEVSTEADRAGEARDSLSRGEGSERQEATGVGCASHVLVIAMPANGGRSYECCMCTVLFMS